MNEETKLGSEKLESGTEKLESGTEKAVPGKKSYHFDILALILWIVLMWGFLAALAFTDSPKDAPGIHELFSYIYFLGFTLIYAAFYILALKKGV